MAFFADLIRFTTPTTGTGTLTVGNRVLPFMTPAGYGAPFNDGALPVYYSIIDFAGGNSETGIGTYTASGTTLTRTPITTTNGGSAISLSGQAQVVITAIANSIRARLSADVTLYVRTDGSDSNNGFSNTSTGAFLTPQKAADTALTWDTGKYNVNIQIGDGTYTSGVSLTSDFEGSGNVTFQGNNGTPANVIISTTSHCFYAGGGAEFAVKDMQLTSSAGAGLYAFTGGQILYQNINFDTCGGSNYPHIFAEYGGTVVCTGNYTIVGGSTTHFWASLASTIKCQSMTITLTGTPAFSLEFARASYCGVLSTVGNTFSGSATGTKFQVESNSVIVTGGSTTYFPGTASTGNTFTGGQYL